VAAMDTSDPRHTTCRRLLEHHPGPLFVPVLVVAEVTYLIERQAGPQAELRFLAELVEGRFEATDVEQSDWVRIAELVTTTYRDLRLGASDASVIAAAERLKIKQIATLDRRHFSVIRPAHVEAFELLP
jgi:uncharacterized protein